MAHLQEQISKDDLMESVNDLAGFLSFRPNFILQALLECTEDIIFIETGNRAGKTASVAKFYTMRLLGMCPVEKRNMRPSTPYRIVRMASQTLPMEPDENGEVRNTIYPQFKLFWPSPWIEKDITMRKPAMVLSDPQGGKPIILDFSSYGQKVQSQAGVDRFSIYLDEQPPKTFFEEQLPRLISSTQEGHGGDCIIGLTPVENMTWTYDEIYQQADVIYNSPAIIDYYSKTYGQKLLRKQHTGSKNGICVIRAASDDNPLLSPEAIESKLMQFRDDKPAYEMRRYGAFHQVSGVIHKGFTSANIISRDKYFPQGMPHQWMHARGADVHEHTDWAVVWMVLSESDEAFVWQEYNPSPDMMTVKQIAREVCSRSRDYKYWLNLCDPLADKNQPSVGISMLQDMNNAFMFYKKEGLGTGGYWETWDTKSVRGRDVVKERLANARLCGVPFNNKRVKDGRLEYLPTLWILDTCPITIHQFKNWKWESWANKEALVTKEEKNKAEDKYSHFPITIECMFKHPGLNRRRAERLIPERRTPYPNMRARA